jgi:hypothetical protein
MIRVRAWGWALPTIAALMSISLPACAFPRTSNTSGGGGIPSWQFRWLPPGGAAPASLSPQAVFSSGAHAEQVESGSVTEHTPAAAVWLAAGQTFGIIAVQLDPAGQYWNLVTMTVDASKRSWQVLAGDIPPTTPCGQGTPFSARFAAFGSYCEVEPVRSGSTSPITAVTLWTTPHSQRFITARITASALRPARGTQALTIANDPGWLLSASGWNAVVVLLPDGDTIPFAGTADAQYCQELAAQFVRLGADPWALGT